MNGFDFGAWLQVALPVAGMLVPLNMALVQASEKFGAAGKVQLAISGIGGLVLGGLASLAFFGIPGDLLGWFLMVIFGMIVAGGSTGTYEAIKHAAIKARE